MQCKARHTINESLGWKYWSTAGLLTYCIYPLIITCTYHILCDWDIRSLPQVSPALTVTVDPGTDMLMLLKLFPWFSHLLFISCHWIPHTSSWIRTRWMNLNVTYYKEALQVSVLILPPSEAFSVCFCVFF